GKLSFRSREAGEESAFSSLCSGRLPARHTILSSRPERTGFFLHALSACRFVEWRDRGLTSDFKATGPPTPPPRSPILECGALFTLSFFAKGRRFYRRKSAHGVPCHSDPAERGPTFSFAPPSGASHNSVIPTGANRFLLACAFCMPVRGVEGSRLDLSFQGHRPVLPLSAPFQNLPHRREWIHPPLRHLRRQLVQFRLTLFPSQHFLKQPRLHHLHQTILPVLDVLLLPL